MGVELPKTATLRLIDKCLVERAKNKQPREYLGCSMVGDECSRRVWYDYHQPDPKYDARLERIFDAGNMYEEYMIGLLRLAGIKVWDVWGPENKQYGVSFLNGGLKGHCDGVGKGFPESDKPHLLEFKSAKNTMFNQLKKKGVKAFSSRYFYQVQLYMHGLNLEKCFFMAINKDNKELYAERIDYDKSEAEFIIGVAEEVLYNPAPLPRAFKITDYRCKNYCPRYRQCWEL